LKSSTISPNFNQQESQVQNFTSFFFPLFSPQTDSDLQQTTRRRQTNKQNPENPNSIYFPNFTPEFKTKHCFSFKIQQTKSLTLIIANPNTHIRDTQYAQPEETRLDTQ
jgi:hypothetical protein